MLRVEGISKGFGARTVLSDVSFRLERGQKAALVGVNGVGKTTLLKILAGIEQPDPGSVEIVRSASIGYLPQDPIFAEQETIHSYLRRVTGIADTEQALARLEGNFTDPKTQQELADLHQRYESLSGYTFEHRAKLMIAGFGLEGIGLDRPLTDLSSGQKSKVALIGILLRGVDLLLLDEPTNNLDIPALIWLEDFLLKSEAACLVVSHDRRFLDRVARKVIELDWHSHGITITSATYSEYLALAAKQRAREREQFRQQQEEIERLTKEAWERRLKADRGGRWVGTDHDKFLRGFKRDRAGKSGKAAKAIETRIEQMEKIEKPVERPLLEIPLKVERRGGGCDITLDEVIVGYATGFQIGPISLYVHFGERVGIMGLNGAGKSTLLKVIAGHLAPLDGRLTVGSGVIIGDLMQEHETLPRDLTPAQFLKSRAGLTETDLYGLLTRFGFDGEQVRGPIETVSPGERARLLLAYFSAISANVLLLDEPTNHLDIEALEALEEVLETYQGTILLVSHDRYFLEQSRLQTTYLLADAVLSKVPDYQAYVQAAEKRARRLLHLL